MHIKNLNSVRLHWREDGDRHGPPVVFANSLGTDLRLWDDVIARLPSSLRLIRFDKRGHGLSSCPPAPYSLDELVDDTEQLLDELGITECAFVGLSIGGLIGQGLAARRPDLIKAMVLSNTAARMGDRAMWQGRIDAIQAGGIEALASAILERWFGEDFRKTDAFEAWQNMLVRCPREGYLGCCAAISEADFTKTTATLKLPVLGIAGSLDGSSPPALVKSTIDMISGARMVTVDGAGHLPCVEAPDHYARIVADFLAEANYV